MNMPRFRPPAEAYSLILQVDRGCPHNRCTFCGMYRGVQYRRCGTEEIRKLIADEARSIPDERRIFLADGDVMRRPFDELREILQLLNDAFPRLARVNQTSVKTGHSRDLTRKLNAPGERILWGR